MKFKLWHVPLRAAAGAFIVNSGVTKLRVEDGDVHKGVHEMASDAYPQFESIEPKTFTRLLGAGETLLGAALLAPIVSPGVAGAALTAFSGGLLGMYFRLPGMTEGGLRPTQQGLPLAKDSWLLAIGLALMLDRTTTKVRDTIPLPGKS